MARRVSRVAFAALLALVPMFVGCEIRSVGVVIPGFDAYEVQGLQLWRRDGSGSYQPAGRITFLRDATPEEFGNVDPEAEWLVYSSGGASNVAEVERDAADPDRVTLRLWYVRLEESGLYKASVFNAAGDSPLSRQALLL